MDPSLRPTSSNEGISVRISKLNIFLWYFMKTITIFSMLLMVLSIYYSFIASEDGNREVLSAIIVLFAMISYAFIIPNLAQLAAVAIPIVKANKHFSIQVLNLFVWMGGFKYPFLIYFSCSSLMVGLGLWKLYGDDGPVFKRVLYVIFVNALQFFTHVFGMFERYASSGKLWVKTGIAKALLGLAIMAFIINFLPPLMKPGEKKINATATISIPCEKMAEASIPGV